MRVGIAISDTAAGMCLGQGILLALLQREQTGRGQWVHTSLLEAMLYMLDFQGARYTMAGEVPEQEGNHHPTVVPMGTFESRDGLVNVAPSSAPHVGRLLQGAGRGTPARGTRTTPTSDRGPGTRRRSARP